MKKTEIGKKWLAVCIMVLFCALLCPAREAQAKWVPGWSCRVMLDGSTMVVLPKNCTFQVEAGQTVYMEYCFGAVNVNVPGSYLEGFRNGDQLNGITYSSSNKAVATVGKKNGQVKTKKVGQTKITVTYQKKKYVCTLNVVKKGALGTTKKYRALNTAANALAKQKNTKITAKNVVSLMEKTLAFRKQAEKYSLRSGFSVSGNKIGNKLIVPAMSAAEAAALRVEDYVSTHDPVEQEKLTVKSLAGNEGSSEIRVTLNRAPTEAEICLVQYHQGMGSNITKLSKKNTTFLVSEVTQSDYVGEEFIDSFTSTEYYAECTLTKGSKIATIVLYEYDPWEGKIDKKAVLKKDYEYTVSFSTNSRGVSFVVN